MRFFIALTLWFILFVLCWPLALIGLFVFFIFWLILLPFRILGFAVGGIFKIAGAILMFPFKAANMAVKR